MVFGITVENTGYLDASADAVAETSFGQVRISLEGITGQLTSHVRYRWQQFTLGLIKLLDLVQGDARIHGRGGLHQVVRDVDRVVLIELDLVGQTVALDVGQSFSDRALVSHVVGSCRCLKVGVR
ncbi:hypothetical protein D3C72_2093160 [compost metagenome]